MAQIARMQTDLFHMLAKHFASPSLPLLAATLAREGGR